VGPPSRGPNACSTNQVPLPPTETCEATQEGLQQENDTIMHGWQRLEAKIVRAHAGVYRTELWVDAEVVSWFSEVEAEYNRLVEQIRSR
jgi:hypothetical protein